MHLHNIRIRSPPCPPQTGILRSHQQRRLCDSTRPRGRLLNSLLHVVDTCPPESPPVKLPWRVLYHWSNVSPQPPIRPTTSLRLSEGRKGFTLTLSMTSCRSPSRLMHPLSQKVRCSRISTNKSLRCNSFLGTVLSRYKARREALPKPPKVLKPTTIDGPPNSFGLRRRYYSTYLPTHDPEEHLKLEDLYESDYKSNLLRQPSSPFGPFPNLSSFQLGEWYVSSGSQASMSSLKQLVKIAQNPDFSVDISQANWPEILDKLGSNKADAELEEVDSIDWMDDDGWRLTPVSISVPLGKATEVHTVGTLYHRSIVAIVQQKILNCPDQRFFHYDPFEIVWQRDQSTRPIRVHSELYNSEAFLQAHRELQDSPPMPGCTRPRVVVGLMFWSDETLLTSFSNEKLWPLYMFFGNESKYRRCNPSSDCCHHVAYFDKVCRFFTYPLLRRLTRTCSYRENSRTLSRVKPRVECHRRSS